MSLCCVSACVLRPDPSSMRISAPYRTGRRGIPPGGDTSCMPLEPEAEHSVRHSPHMHTGKQHTHIR